MSHANAALTPRARLRLARLIVDQGWPVARAAERYDVSWPTAKRWADRYRSSARPGWVMRPPGRTARRTGPPSRWSARSCTCAGSSGSARCRSPSRPASPHRRSTRYWSGAGSAGSPTIDRVTGEPVRRYEHDHPGSLVHVDVKKLGNVPDGGGWRYVGRAQGQQNRTVTAPRTGRHSQTYRPPADRDRVHPHRPRRPLPGRLLRDPRRRDPGRPPSPCSATPSPGSPHRGVTDRASPV